MLRIRPGLVALFRNVSPEEYAVLSACADERGRLSPEERASYIVPEAADASIVGAILWSTFVLWQDHPMFFVLGFLGGAFSIVMRVVDLLR